MRPDLVVHPQGCRLVDGNNHCLALEAAPEEVLDDIFGNGLKPFIACEQLILPAQFSLQPFLLLFIQPGGFDQVVDVVIEVRIL